MTSKTSFFNKGIYKSTVKRYMWGAVLYFIILFLSTGLSVLLNVEAQNVSLYNDEYSLILRSNYMVFPMLLAIVAPTVVALMVFRFIHSKKQSIFIHSIPVCRKANFISSILASFTLMCAPVLLNGIILILISICGYGDYFSVVHCFEWIGYNLLGIFLMFSVAVFAANLTGNSFAAIAINVLIHSFLFITVATIGVMAQAFLYGYNDNYTIYNTIADNNFAVIVFGFMDRHFRDNTSAIQLIRCVIAAVVFYVGSYFLYKRRRLETATDVAGYKCLNPIFKYIVSFLVTMFGFAIFSYYIEENVLVFAVIVAIISIVAYAASEMVLKKTINVLYSWKGYVGFAVFFIALVVLLSQTSFFGYETRVPEKADIAQATIYNYYHQEEEPFTINANIIDMVVDAHKSLISDGNIPKVKGHFNTRLHIKYKLTNGKTMYRIYPVTKDQCIEIMNKFYENEEYKKKCEKIFIDDSKIIKMYVNENLVEDYNGLVTALREDILDLNYGDLYYHDYEQNPVLHHVRVEYETSHTIKEDGIPRAIINSVYTDVTAKHVRTLKWLEENGYKQSEYTER